MDTIPAGIDVTRYVASHGAVPEHDVKGTWIFSWVNDDGTVAPHPTEIRFTGYFSEALRYVGCDPHARWRLEP
jgi:hypothetical protein